LYSQNESSNESEPVSAITSCPSGYVYEYSAAGFPGVQVQLCLKREENIPCYSKDFSGMVCNRTTYLVVPAGIILSAYTDNTIRVTEVTENRILVQFLDSSLVQKEVYLSSGESHFEWIPMNNIAVTAWDFSPQQGIVGKIQVESIVGENVKPSIVKEYKNVTVGETFYITETATTPYEWRLKSYDRDYLEHKLGGIGCTPDGICTYSFQFTALKEGNTTVELSEINTADNSTVEIRYIHITIIPKPPVVVTHEYKTVALGETFEVVASVGDWRIKSYDKNYLEFLGQAICPPTGECYARFAFKALATGNTTIELNKFIDNQLSEIRYVYVTIKPKVSIEEEYKTVGVGDVFTVSDDVAGGTPLKIELKSYDSNYLELLSKDSMCATLPGGPCYYNFKFKAINSGKTTIELDTINTIDNSTVSIKYVYVTIVSSAIKIVHLDEPFDLKEGEQAEVVDYKNMLIELQKIEKFKATIPYEHEIDVVTLSIKMPTGEVSVVPIEEGTSKEVFGVVIKVLDINFDTRVARFLVTLKEAKFNLNVKTDKYTYSPGDTAKIYITLSGDPSIDFSRVSLTVEVTGPIPKVIPLVPERVGSVAPALTQATTTGGYTTPIVHEYLFIAKYPLPQDASSGIYSINVVARLEDMEESASTSFEVRKVYSEYVDVSIKPKEQHASVGEPVTYYITVTDRHPVPIIIPTPATVVTPSTTTVSTPSTTTTLIPYYRPIYTYMISVYGLPYNSIYPTTVNVPAGGSETFELKIFPSPTKTTTVVKEVTPIFPSPTVIPSAAERTVSIPTGKAAVEKVVPEPVEVMIKFSVQAMLQDDPRVSDSDDAILYVRYVETPVPPPFPEPETINIRLNKGWNLISVPGKGSFTSGTCSATQKPIAFVYLPDEHRYVSMDEALRIMGKEKLSDYLSTHSFWVYSYESCDIGFKLESYSSYSGLSINEGWNLLGVTKDMVGETLDSIKGSCTFLKVYIWDIDSQKWVEKTTNDLIEKMGYGILVKADSACKLKENIIQPPPFPGG